MKIIISIRSSESDKKHFSILLVNVKKCCCQKKASTTPESLQIGEIVVHDDLQIELIYFKRKNWR